MTTCPIELRDNSNMDWRVSRRVYPMKWTSVGVGALMPSTCRSSLCLPHSATSYIREATWASAFAHTYTLNPVDLWTT